MKKLFMWIFLLVGLITSGCVQQGESATDISEIKSTLDSMSADLEDANKKLEETNSKLEEMEKKLNIVMPSFAEIMPDYAERFHVMHFSGDAMDWSVAQHEILSMKDVRKKGEAIDPVKGAIMKAFEEAYLDPVEEAIESQDHDKFMELLEKVPEGCNNCHVAVGSPFVKIGLKVPTTLSLRHPHILEKSELAEGHAHENGH